MEIASSRRRELDISRHTAGQLGRSAVEDAVNGLYISEAGKKIDWRSYVQAACSANVSIPPDAILPESEFIIFPETRVQIANETTLGASRRLVEKGM
jgi:hypothetical protein